jgi:hypothetical protein
LLPFERSTRLSIRGSHVAPRLGVIAILASVGVGTVSFALTSAQASELEGLARTGVRAAATVTRLPAQHNSVEYIFKVGGSTYHGASFANPPNPSADQLAAGEEIQIVYQAGNPSDSCACTPAAEAPGQRLFPLVTAILFGLGAAAAYGAAWVAADGRLNAPTATQQAAAKIRPSLGRSRITPRQVVLVWLGLAALEIVGLIRQAPSTTILSAELAVIFGAATVLMYFYLRNACLWVETATFGDTTVFGRSRTFRRENVGRVAIRTIVNQPWVLVLDKANRCLLWKYAGYFSVDDMKNVASALAVPLEGGSGFGNARPAP